MSEIRELQDGLRDSLELDVLDIGHWSPSKEFADSRNNFWDPISQCSEHLQGTLGVTNVRELGNTGSVRDKAQHGDKILRSEIIKGKRPECFFVCVRVECRVVTGMHVTTVVAHPNIVSGLS